MWLKAALYSLTLLTQSEVNVDLKTLFAQLKSLEHGFRRGSIDRFCQLINICFDYRAAKQSANQHRMAARMKDPAMINLDSITDSGLDNIEMMVDIENKALDPCYKAITLIRSELNALQEIKLTCSQILEIVDESTGHGVSELEVYMITLWATGKERNLIAALRHLD